MNEYSPEESEPPSPPRPPKPSMAPSWAMLGFAFGALFILALPRREPVAPPPPVSETPALTTVLLTPPRLTTIENVFAEWSRVAVWENDLTEVALWNSQRKSYSDCYEVLRSGEAFFFRTISRLTRPVLTHGVSPNSPLQFTEPQAARDQWLGEKNQAMFERYSEEARKNIPSMGGRPAEDRK